MHEDYGSVNCSFGSSFHAASETFCLYWFLASHVSKFRSFLDKHCEEVMFDVRININLQDIMALLHVIRVKNRVRDPKFHFLIEDCNNGSKREFRCK